MPTFMNVVRSKVKEGKKDELMKKFKEFFDNMKGTDGLISMKLIQTGPNNMCTIGEWKDEQSIAKARDKMIAGLDTVRPLLIQCFILSTSKLTLSFFVFGNNGLKKPTLSINLPSLGNLLSAITIL